MYVLVTCFLFPIINAIVVVKIHRFTIYNPIYPCAFLRNTSLSWDPSLQGCIWECVHETPCQTAVYFTDQNVCSLFTESCKSDGIQSSGNIRASVICYRTNQGELFCSNIQRYRFLRADHYLFFCRDTVSSSRWQDNSFYYDYKYWRKYVGHMNFFLPVSLETSMFAQLKVTKLF